jgi:hypothetical protein
VDEIWSRGQALAILEVNYWAFSRRKGSRFSRHLYHMVSYTHFIDMGIQYLALMETGCRPSTVVAIITRRVGLLRYVSTSYSYLGTVTKCIERF